MRVSTLQEAITYTEMAEVQLNIIHLSYTEIKSILQYLTGKIQLTMRLRDNNRYLHRVGLVGDSVSWYRTLEEKTQGDRDVSIQCTGDNMMTS